MVSRIDLGENNPLPTIRRPTITNTTEVIPNDLSAEIHPKRLPMMVVISSLKSTSSFGRDRKDNQHQLFVHEPRIPSTISRKQNIEGTSVII